jgi:glutamate-1-semialdehyde 2,1-aminomutase
MKEKIPYPDNARRYALSEELLARAEKSIPLGAQTFSKSKTQYPYGVSPYFIKSGKGSHVFDVDDNEYVDLNNALAAITIGYCDPEINAAVQKQLDVGTIFSLSNTLEIDVAEKIIEMVPCAEKVRFGKNGSDATAGAIRIARAYTGRDHVLACGYHGWQDWYIGATTRSKGVPKAVQGLTHMFPYNDIAAVDKLFREHKDSVAAVIMEPMNVSEPSEGYFEELKELVHKNGALFIFDETVTGFRLSNGGAQEYFGVTPDLATFGKGMANGFPISAITGHDKFMKEMEEIFFSFTYGGELLSLAAANAVLDKLKREPVLRMIAQKGAYLKNGVNSLIEKYELQDTLSVSGHDTWNFLIVKDHSSADSFTIKTFFMQEMLRQGVLTLGAHVLTYAHTQQDLDRCLTAYETFLASLSEHLQQGNLQSALKCDVLRPLMKIR